MNLWQTLGKWASDAWGFLSGLPGDASKALAAVWHYVTSLHNVLQWVIGYPVLKYIVTALAHMNAVSVAITIITDALHRIAGWIWLTMVKPVRDQLNRRIDQLRAWTAAQLYALTQLVITLFLRSMAYTRQLVGAERGQRIKADQAEHAAMLKAVAAAIALVQQQAASGYNSGLHERTSVVSKLLDQLAGRNPAVRALTRLLVKAVIDLETIDNPLARFVVSKLVSQVISRAGTDKIIATLVSDLLGPLAGQPKARGLSDVTRDVSERLGALESQWAAFMAAGGPEVEQAGSEWQALTSLTVDAALLGVFGLAVTSPQDWAAGVADTIGTAGNAALDAVISVISKA